MAIAPVDSVKFSSYNCKPSFLSRDKEPNSSIEIRNTKKGPMVTIPLAMLIALSPSLSNAKTVDESEMLNLPAIELYASQNVAAQKEKNPNVYKTLYRLVHPDHINMGKFKAGGKDYTMYVHNLAHDVYFVPDGYYLYRDKRDKAIEYNRPPILKEIIIHDLPNDESFIGLKVVEYTSDSNGENRKKRVYELKLAENEGDNIINFIVGDTDIEPPRDAKEMISHVTTKELMTPKVTDNKVF